MDMSKVIQHPFFDEVRKTGKTQIINDWCVTNGIKNLAGMVLMPELKESHENAGRLLDAMLESLRNDELISTTPQALLDKALASAPVAAPAPAPVDGILNDDPLKLKASIAPQRVVKPDPAEVEDLARDAMTPIPTQEEKKAAILEDLEENADVRSPRTSLQGFPPEEMGDPILEGKVKQSYAQSVQEQVTEAMARAIPTIVTAVLDETDKRYIKLRDYTITLSIDKEANEND